MTKKRYLIAGFGVVVAVSFGSYAANAQTVDGGGDKDQKHLYYNGGNEVLIKSPIEGELAKYFNDRIDMDFLLKPGSGWILQGIVPIVTGVPMTILFGFCISLNKAFNPNSDTYPLYLPLFTGLAATVAGTFMIGYGAIQNGKFEKGETEYLSPATGYIAGGSINLLIGGGAITGGTLLLKWNKDPLIGEVMTSLGGVFAAYGLGFFIYGLANDFEKKAGSQANLKRILGSLTPFVGCTGGMCDGNGSKATGRETYFAGIKGEF